MEVTNGYAEPQATSLTDLTIQAMDDQDSRLDWDWTITRYIREWEARHERVYAGKGGLLNAHFTWYHYQEICSRVMFRIELEHEALRGAIADPDDAKKLNEFAVHIIIDIVFPECERMFDKVASAMSRHKLPLYTKLRGRGLSR